MSTTGESWDLESGTFTYDSVGNVLTAPAPYGLTAATYDRRKLPTSQTANSVTSAYRYDGSGQRISKQVGSGDTEYYVLEGPLTLGVFTLDGSDSVTAWHFNLEAGGAVVGRETDAGDRYYYHTDMLGSTRTVVDDEGTAVEGYFYYPFGLLSENLSPNAGGTKEGFTGKEFDAESGLQYFGARYYMPALTRWGQVDPLADSYPSWTPYNYVLGNPVGLVDPDGMCPRSESAGCAGEANDAAQEAQQTETGDQEAAQSAARATEAEVRAALPPGLGGCDGPGCRVADASTELVRDDPVLAAGMAAATVAGAVAAAGTAGAGPALGATEGVTVSTGTSLVPNISAHAAKRMGERGITRRMTEVAKRVGEAFLDPKNGVINTVIRGGMASGKDLLVGTRIGQPNLVTTALKTVRAVAKRFIPYK